ncbi:MAG: right-handed parallel beta-helix repeat-containing protein, partial [Phycisphaerae bacterium]|nr:right-handed parallel beta-helix repeat-containing protein [Phycisphaerae bacterium]
MLIIAVSCRAEWAVCVADVSSIEERVLEGTGFLTATTRRTGLMLAGVLWLAAAFAATGGGVAAAWVPPIGIPEPDFGIHETVSGVYGSEDYYTHYVNNAHPAATDDNNPFGSPTQPRLTIPPVLAAGSVVYVDAGVYSTGSMSTLRGNGTAALPVFIRGNSAGRPKITIETTFIGTHFIIEHLDFDGTSAQGNVLGPSDRVCIRHCEVQNAQGNGAGLVAVGSWDGSDPTVVRNIVFYANVIHDLGDLGAQTDQDHHGFVFGHHANHIWMLDNEVYNTSGSGLQVNSGFLDETGDRPAHHVYVGRNHVHHVRQSGLTVKKARDVVFSENVVHDVISTSWSVSKGLAFQYGPYNLWYIYNHVYDNEWGINAPSNDGGPGGDVYFVGNLIHDCGLGITCWNNQQTAHIVGNTIADCGGGIRYENGPGIRLANNILSNMSAAEHINVFGGSGSTAADSTSTHDLFYQPAGPIQIKWSSSTYTSVAAFQSATGKGQGDLEGDPAFVDAGSGDYHALPGSPTTDTGTASSVYDQYLSFFGQDIAVDLDGVPRTAGLGHDIGCFEQYQYQTCVNPSECDDGIDCTVDDCIGGFCTHVPSHSLCVDDGLYCTGAEICSVRLGC